MNWTTLNDSFGYLNLSNTEVQHYASLLNELFVHMKSMFVADKMAKNVFSALMENPLYN